MSYNTRRSGVAVGNVGKPTVPASAVGQRRSAPAGNFVAGGQLNNSPGLQGAQNFNQQRKPEQNYNQQQMQFNSQQQAQQQRPQGNMQQSAQQMVLQQQQKQQQMQQQQQQQQPKIVFKTEPVKNVQVDAPMDIGSNGNEQGLTEPKQKPAWIKNAGKISKKERMRRRNKKLVRILQPKNAVMVLNEMVGNVAYTLAENSEINPYTGEQKLFKASVVVDGIEHHGCGKSKMAAKAAAAETAIKYLVLKKLKTTGQTTNSVIDQADNGGDVNMEDGAEENANVLPWQHVASFALHKLFCNWDDGTNLAERLITGSSTGGDMTAMGGQTPEKKPAKKMPDNPHLMNPVMLLNQMVPNAQYEELSKSGNPPNISFTYKCTANGQVFTGTGSTKKLAKKMCAFDACSNLLGIQYPEDVLVENKPTVG